MILSDRYDDRDRARIAAERRSTLPPTIRAAMDAGLGAVHAALARPPRREEQEEVERFDEMTGPMEGGGA